MKLVIGNKNYSSWSLRPWLALRVGDIPFDEIRIPLDEPETRARLLAVSPTARVPVLIDGDLTVWDSLAICEYAAERFPERALWPQHPALRARARSIVSEMHSGFTALRRTMPMNCRSRLPGKGQTPAAMADVARIVELWNEALLASGGPFLFGAFSIADAFYAPVTSRFVTYAVPLPPPCQRYVETVQALPAMVAWNVAAASEREWIAADEPYADRPAEPPGAL